MSGDWMNMNTKAKKLFVIRPGDVVSRNDGQTHHIDARKLAKLYHIPDGFWVEDGPASLGLTGVVLLGPLECGNYYNAPDKHWPGLMEAYRALEQAKASALAKLTPEERKVLGF